MKREVFVKIGEVKVGRDEDTLNATLGSCVGIAYCQPIGQQSYKKVRALLKEKGFQVKSEDVGGDIARQIIVKCGTAKVIVRKINPVSN